MGRLVEADEANREERIKDLDVVLERVIGGIREGETVELLVAGEVMGGMISGEFDEILKKVLPLVGVIAEREVEPEIIPGENADECVILFKVPAIIFPHKPINFTVVLLLCNIADDNDIEIFGGSVTPDKLRIGFIYYNVQNKLDVVLVDRREITANVMIRNYLESKTEEGLRESEYGIGGVSCAIEGKSLRLKVTPEERWG
jgi:hypothetical protein